MTNFLPEALDRLVDLSTAKNKPDEVKKSQSRAGEVPGGTRSAAGGEEAQVIVIQWAS